jgi:hypothetical protein
LKALWIRVEAHAIESIEVARFAEHLDVDVVTAFGHYCALGGSIAEHAPEGHIADVPNAAIERWGHWHGKRGRFATAVRAVLEDEDGNFLEWLDSMGKLIERRERERTRKSGGNSAEIPRRDRGISGATERNGTERDVTERTASSSVNQNSNRRSGDLDPESARARANGASPHEPGSAPPADALRPEDLPPAAQALVARFYPRGETDPRRRRDVVTQLLATLGAGARYRKAPVRAHSIDRLERRCAEVLREGMKDPDKAIVVLLAKLSDTSDLSADRQRRELDERADEERTEAHDVAAADAWLVDRPDVAAAIDVQLDAEGLVAGDALQDSVRRITARSLLLAAWRADGAPELVSKP